MTPETILKVLSFLLGPETKPASKKPLSYPAGMPGYVSPAANTFSPPYQGAPLGNDKFQFGPTSPFSQYNHNGQPYPVILGPLPNVPPNAS